MKKRQKKQPKQTNMTASAPQKMEAFTFGEPSPFWIAATFSTMSNASITANGTSRRSTSRAGKKPARRRAPQLPDLR
jgi:hypothetical protein